MPDTKELFDCKIVYNGDYRFDERDIDAIIQGVDLTARMGKMSVFVLDLEEKRIRYSSPDMLFAKEIGKDRQANGNANLYWCAMSEQTTRIMLRLRETFLDFTQGRLADFMLFMDYPVIINGQEVYIHQESRTLTTFPDGTVKLCLIGMKCSVRSRMKCAAIKKDGSTWTYDFARNCFKMEEDDFSQLSQTEKAILKMAEMGCSKEDISKLKNISLNTVKSHYRNIFRKLGVSNISSAITCIRNSY